MSVYRRFDNREFPSLVTTSVAERRRVFSSEAAARLFINVLEETRIETGFHLLAFAVMPDHVHLVMSAPASGRLGQVIQLVKGRFARRYNLVHGGSGPFWQSRYHERALRSERELSATIEYVHQNPVAARLAATAAGYPWSSANARYPTDLALYLSQAEA